MDRRFVGVLILVLCGATAASAETVAEHGPETRQAAIWEHLFEPLPASESSATPASTEGSEHLRLFDHVDFAQAAAPAVAPAAAAAQTAPPKAFEYSDAYNTRRKIHFYASFATLPLFAAQYVLGDKLFDREPGENGGSTKSAHSAAAIGIEALFGINTVTGVWNMWEARKDPNGRAKRLTHGLMMLGADVGFVATGLLAPDDDSTDGRSTHRNVALASMGVATASYLIMLFGR